MDSLEGLIGHVSLKPRIYECVACGGYCIHDRERDASVRVPFQVGVDLPASGVQLHAHGFTPDNLEFGHYKTYGGDILQPTLSGLETVRALDLAKDLGFKTFGR